jgi:hypothetical protein
VSHHDGGAAVPAILQVNDPLIYQIGEIDGTVYLLVRFERISRLPVLNLYTITRVKMKKTALTLLAFLFSGVSVAQVQDAPGPAQRAIDYSPFP